MLRLPSYSSSKKTTLVTDTHTHTHTHTQTDYSTLAMRPRTARLTMYANMITLDCCDISEKVVFVESNDCYEIYFKCPENKAKIEKELDSILSSTIMKRQFKSEIRPKKASFCPCSQQPRHAAILKLRGTCTMRCTKSNKIVTLTKGMYIFVILYVQPKIVSSNIVVASKCVFILPSYTKHFKDGSLNP